MIPLCQLLLYFTITTLVPVNMNYVLTHSINCLINLTVFNLTLTKMMSQGLDLSS